MKRLTAEEVAARLQKWHEQCGLSEYCKGQSYAFRESSKFVMDNLIPRWQDAPDADGWHWCEELDSDSPPQKLRSYRQFCADGEGKFYVDFNGCKKWQRWTVSGWVPLVGRVCPIGVRPST